MPSVAFVDSGISAGIPATPDDNVASDDGTRYLEQTSRNGWRCSAATVYLRSATARTRPAIETGASVTRIDFEGSRAAAVEYEQGRQRRPANAAGEVLLATGAVKSLHVLELSGVGDAGRLRSPRIPVVLDSPHVGAHSTPCPRIPGRILRSSPMTSRIRTTGPRRSTCSD